jgi:prepilin-type N-terminal cleavage/methylation domain-containing protein
MPISTVKPVNTVNTVLEIDKNSNFTSKNNNSKNSNSKNHNNRKTISKNNGFSLIEIMISLVLVSAILAVVLTMTMGGVVGGKKTQAIADLRTLSLQKTTELSNNLTNELKKISLTETRVGSINPDIVINGYFDELNEQGCVIRSSNIIQPPIIIEPPTKGLKQPNNSTDTGSARSTTTTSTGRLGDLGNGDSDTTNTTIDCSKSTYPVNPASNSTISAYRRQWAIIKDKPNKGDSTIAVIIVDKKTDQIIRTETLVKVDGVSRK